MGLAYFAKANLAYGFGTIEPEDFVESFNVCNKNELFYKKNTFFQF
jgi:hypothetical protein